jgi:L,D-transpeptidase ErfK/SrfK
MPSPSISPTLWNGAALSLALLLSLTSAGCGLFRQPTPPPEPAPAPEPHLVLKLGERRVYVIEDGKPTESFLVAVGRKPYETPVGTFRINEMVKDPDWVQFDWKNPERTIRRIPPGPNNPMGRRWIGFASAYGWEVGFHGTPKPQVLGQAVSHGCVRMANDDVVKLFDRVKLGTTVIVEP